MSDRRLFAGFGTQNLNNQKGWTLYDLDLVKQDLYNHFYTRVGERPMLPRYGSEVWDYLFEPFTSVVRDAVEDDVRRVIGTDPRVQLIELKVSTFAHGIMIDAVLKYTPWDVVDTFSVSFDRRSQEG